MDQYKELTDRARDMECHKITIVWDCDGPISIGEDFDMPWIQILYCSPDDEGSMNYINISELETAKALRKALTRFIKKKKDEENKKSKNKTA